MKNLMYGIFGMIVTFFVFLIIANFLHASDAQSFILVGISIISGVILFCTRCIVEKIEQIGNAGSQQHSGEIEESIEEN